MPRVAVVTTGHEVLRGDTPNTNAAWLARRLTESGWTVTSVRTVGDGVDDVVGALRAAAAEADAVVATGGLGPTEDDRTREALAALLGQPLEHDEAAWRGVAAWFERAGRAPSPVQRRQALRPAGASVIPNPVGTAPGLAARVGGADLFLLPGPPREMRWMAQAEVLPRLAGRGLPTAVRVLWTAGVPESEVAAPLAAFMRADEPVVGTHPDEGEVAVRVLARGPGADERADAVVAAARAALGDAVVSDREEVRVQHALVALLRARGLVVATAESATGGLAARMLVEVEGASEAFRGGWVAYSDAWKARALGVPEALLAARGAVCEEVARAMAEGALDRAGADLAVATTGVAGPGPDPRGVPAGTVHLACARRGGPTVARVLRIPLPRLTVQRRAAVAALDLARRALLGAPAGR